MSWYPTAKGTGVSLQEFSEGRVRELIKDFTLGGSRQVFSIQNIKGGEWIENTANDFINSGKDWVIGSISRQNFSLEDSTGIKESEPLYNVLVEITSEDVINNNALMFVSHFDGMFNSPGASDNASGVCSLLELLRNLVNMAKGIKFPVLFAFVNSEENGFYGSSHLHSYNRFDDIKRFVNIDNMGGKGKTMMVKVEPSVLAREVGKMRFIQGDQTLISLMDQFPHHTDFEALRKHDIPGFEFSQSHMSFEYHTDLDDESSIVDGSLQLLGKTLEKFIEVYLQDEDSPLDKNPKAESDNEYVFYNFLGVDYRSYSSTVSLVFSILFFFMVAFILVSCYMGLDYAQFHIKPGDRGYKTTPMESIGDEPSGLWGHLFKKLIILFFYAFGYTMSFICAFGTGSICALLISTKHILAFQRDFTLSTITICLAGIVGILIPQFFVHVFLHYCFQLRHEFDISDRYVSLYILTSIVAVVFESLDFQIPSLWFYTLNFPAAFFLVMICVLLQKLLLHAVDPDRIMKKKDNNKVSKVKEDSVGDGEVDSSSGHSEGDEEEDSRIDIEQFLDAGSRSVGDVDPDIARGLSELIPPDSREDVSSFETDEKDRNRTEDDVNELIDEIVPKDIAGESDNSIKGYGRTTSDDDGEDDGKMDQSTSGGGTTSEESTHDEEKKDERIDTSDINLKTTDTEKEGSDLELEEGGSSDDTGEEEDVRSSSADDEVEVSEYDSGERKRQSSKKSTKRGRKKGKGVVTSERIMEFIYHIVYVALRREKCCFGTIPFLMLVVSIFHMTVAYTFLMEVFPEFGRDKYVLPAVSYSFIVSYFVVSVFACVIPWFHRAANFIRVILLLLVLLIILIPITLTQYPYTSERPKRIVLTIFSEKAQTINVPAPGQPLKEFGTEYPSQSVGSMFSVDNAEIGRDSDVFDYYTKKYDRSDIDCSDGGVCTFPLDFVTAEMKKITKYKVHRKGTNVFDFEMEYDDTALVLISFSDNVQIMTWYGSNVMNSSAANTFSLVNVISNSLKCQVKVKSESFVDVEIVVKYCDDNAKISQKFVSQWFEDNDKMTLVGRPCDSSHSEERKRKGLDCLCEFLENKYNIKLQM